MKFLFICLLLTSIAGCTSENLLECIYDGVINKEKLDNPATDPILSKKPSYSEYKREREEYLKEDAQNQQ